MNEADNTTLRIGALMADLAACIQELNRARSEAHDLAPDLRLLADCFDRDNQDVNMVELLGETDFTVHDKRPSEKRERGRGKPVSQTRINPDGSRGPIRSIPDGSRLVEIAQRIQQAKVKAEDILDKLRNEHIDVRGICKALAE
ncbi:MAG: hypothetical protein OXC13_11485 [Caldilineaceae bacterium]|nr:hypothetical protein [Caldilineaceae bacterium]